MMGDARPTFGESCIGLIVHRQMLVPTADNMSGRKMAVNYIDGGFAAATDALRERVRVLEIQLEHLVKAVEETEKQWGKAINIAVHCSAREARALLTHREQP